jgi:hypothetical protein
VSTFIGLLVLVLQKLQQALVEVEMSAAPVHPLDGERNPSPERLADAPLHGGTRAEDHAFPVLGGQDAFLFRHGAEDDRRANAGPHHGDGIEDATVYDRIVTFLIFGDSEVQLADSKPGFDLWWGLCNPAEGDVTLSWT